MNDNFRDFVAPAKIHSGGLQLIGALIFMVLCYTALTFAWMGVFTLWTAGGDLDALEKSFVLVTQTMGDTEKPQAMIMLLLTFTAMFAAVALTVGLFRSQPFAVLLGRGPHRPLVRQTLMVLIPVYAAAFGVAFLTAGPEPNLALPSWIMWVALALPLLLVQVTAEELVFRGYLMQELAARYKSRWIWFVLPAVVFGMLHYEPAIFGANAALVVVSTTLFGIIAADLTVRTGSLAPAITFHFINNFMAMMLMSLDGTLTGLALFVTSVHATDEAAVRVFLLADIAVIGLGYLVYLLIMKRRERLHSPFTRLK